MELGQLHYFLVAAQYESFTKAAHELYITQPALSASIRNLEKRLGVELFERKGNRIILNEKGRCLAQQIKKAETLIDEAMDKVKAEDDMHDNTVNMCLSAPMSAAIIRAFLEENPDVHIRHGYQGSSLFNGVRVDLHYFASKTPLPESDDLIPLGFERYKLIVPFLLDLPAGKPVNLGDMRDFRFAFGEGPDSLIYQDTLLMCNRAGFIPRPILESQFSVEALNIVEHGVACAIAGEFTWLAGRHRQFSVHDIEGSTEGRYLYLRKVEGGSSSSTVNSFAEYLMDFAMDRGLYR